MNGVARIFVLSNNVTWEIDLGNVEVNAFACHRIGSNRPVAQIPQCTNPISHNAPFCTINVHISITK